MSNKTEQQWREQLTPEQYHVLREKGTERPFTGEYNDCEKDGIYQCAACGQALFDADTKFDAGCGWPSFFAPLSDDAVANASDRSHGMTRTETLCSNCGSHLGHVFPDGPKPTGQRYCMNSVSLQLVEKK